MNELEQRIMNASVQRLEQAWMALASVVQTVRRSGRRDHAHCLADVAEPAQSRDPLSTYRRPPMSLGHGIA